MLRNPVRADGPELIDANGTPCEDDHQERDTGDHCHPYSCPDHFRTFAFGRLRCLLGARVGFKVCLRDTLTRNRFSVPGPCVLAIGGHVQKLRIEERVEGGLAHHPFDSA